MPEITTTINQLIKMRSEIEEYSKNSITYALFNKEKIARFFKLNSIRLKQADEKLSRMIDKLVQKDDEGKPKKETGEDGITRFVFNNENDSKTFQIDYENFMGKGCTIQY